MRLIDADELREYMERHCEFCKNRLRIYEYLQGRCELCPMSQVYALIDPEAGLKTQTRKWIPVSERLPPYSEKIVLATVVRRDKTWNNDPYHRLVTYSQGKWYPVPQSINLVPCRMATIEQSDGGQAEVIAWMPLPDTYREEASE